MKTTYEYAAAINWGKCKYECFDAFAKVADIFTLCDGANSCESSGKLATDLAHSFSERLSFLDKEIIGTFSVDNLTNSVASVPLPVTSIMLK